MQVLLTNPDVVFLLLMLAFWLAAAAVYMAGSGVLETGAVLLTIGVGVLLAQLPTNWVAVMLILFGMAVFHLAPLFAPRFSTLAVGGLGLQALGAFLLFDGLSVSPLLIAVAVLVGLLFHLFILMPVLRSQKQGSDYDRATQLIGARGRVVTALDPVGAVNVAGETWTARSAEGERIEADTEVIVLEKHGLEVRVRKAKRDE